MKAPILPSSPPPTLYSSLLPNDFVIPLIKQMESVSRTLIWASLMTSVGQ